ARRGRPRRRRLPDPAGHDAAHLRRRGRALRREPAGARRLRSHRAHAPGSDRRGPAAGVVHRRARAAGLHRPPPGSAGAALARGRRAGALRDAHAPPRLDRLAQGRPDLGLPRRDRRAAHRVRPVRVLHGGHDRVGRGDPSLQGGRALEGGRAPVIEGLVGLAAMMVIAFLRVPIAYAMGIVGIVGYAYMRDWNWLVASAMVQTKIYETGRNYTLSVVPLFILMGSFVTRAGMSEELFRAAYTFIGHLRGGLAMATVWASAGFGGICGSSIATAATMAKVAYPSMKRFGYHDQLAAGTVAGAGTLGIMIPPSTFLFIDAASTETNIGKLFAAGVLPGILGAFLLCGAIMCTTWRHPEWGPPGPRSSWGERWLALKDVWGVAALFLFVMGGIYGGLFTATEGAGMGAMGALLFALAR